MFEVYGGFWGFIAFMVIVRWALNLERDVKEIKLGTSKKVSSISDSDRHLID